MKQLHFFPVRSAKTMRREQRGTVSVRLLNVFNVFKAFPEPNRARRMRIPARFYGVLLAGMFGLVLTGCAAGDGDPDPDPQNFPAVSNIQTLIGEDHILVGWTNPDSDNIAGFVITTRRDDASDGGTRELNSTVADVAPLARVIYNITGLTNNIAYNITIAVRYENGIIGTSPPVSGTTGAGAGVGTDIDDDGEDNNIDNCPLDANADQTNTDNADDRGDACDDDDDNDGVKDTTDLCPTGVTGWTSNASADNDGDGCRDNDEDVDDNNNGLIEIRTLDDLARLRDDLNGDGADDGRIPEITSVGSMGCPDDDDGGCEGYELTRSFNFSDDASYAAGSGNQVVWTTGSGWQPIGSCFALDVCTSSYTGIFDGGGYRIADLFISANNTANGVGLFGALTGGIQNLHLRNVRVSGGATDVGGLVGYGRNADIRNASVSGVDVAGLSFFAGGLVGFGQDADVRYASVSGGSVSGNNSVGGLVGYGDNADIRNASVSGVNVAGGRNVVGGLVGYGGNADIRYAYVLGGSVSGNNSVGGLVGDGRNADIRYAPVSGVNVAGSFSVGGLAGFGKDANIRYAYVLGGSVSGNNSVGGLVGYGDNASIRYAYVLGGSVSGGGKSIVVGGLVGQGVRAQINYSYAAPGLVSGGDEDVVGGLIGITNSGADVTASYWDNQTTMQSMSAGNLGEGHSTRDLQSPTDFTGIYADWGNAWCNPNTGAESTTELPAPFVRVWDLGNSTQYPALSCVPGGLSAQDR